MASISAKDKIMVEKLKLMTSHRFFASLMLHLKFIEITDTNREKLKGLKNEKAKYTMGVNAKGEVYYDPIFVESLQGDDLKFVLCHELMHCVLRHMYRQPPKAIHELFNIAADAVINYILVYKESFNVSEALRKTAILPTSDGILRLHIGEKQKPYDLIIKDKTTEAIYYELLKLAKSSDANCGSCGDGYIRPIGGQGFDKHLSSDPQDSNDEGDESSDGGAEGSMSEAEAQDLDRKWSSAVAAANMEDSSNSRSSSEGWLSRLINEFAKPQLNWRALLRKHIKETIPYDCSFKRPKKRTYSTGVYVPIMNFRPHIITCAVDISGSISDKELKTFITEIYGITRAYNNIDIRVVFWSTKVDEENDIIYKARKIRDVLSVKAFTTGGTTISCVEDYIANNDKKESSIIYLTDGYVEPEPNFKCTKKKRLFIIQAEGQTSILEKFGQTARLRD